MNGIRRFLGSLLLFCASVALGASKGLYWLGRAVLPDRGANGAVRGSGGRGAVLHPHTVRLDSGRYVTLYSIGRK